MWTRALVVALSLAAFAAPLGGAASGTEPSTTQPARAKALLRVVDQSPVSVRGMHFRSREAVRVVVRLGDGSFVRQTRANLAGAFTVTFAGIRYDACGTPPEITARGVRTGIVSVAVLPRDCAMP